jgi:hypothetical protein
MEANLVLLSLRSKRGVIVKAVTVSIGCSHAVKKAEYNSKEAKEAVQKP